VPGGLPLEAPTGQPGVAAGSPGQRRHSGGVDTGERS